MRLGIYCRISKLKDEGRDRSIDNQKKLGIKKAKELGLDYEVYIDEGYSGTLDKIEDRPDFERLLQDIVNGRTTALFVFDQSRLERSPQVRFVVNKLLKQYNVVCYSHVDGLIDLNDPQSEFFGDIVSVINKYQVTMTKIKVRSVLKQRAMEGKAHGIEPYGYCRDENGYMKINKEEAKIVKQIFAWSLKGIGTRSIADLLNKDGVLTRYNKIAKGTLSTKNKYTKKVTTVTKKDIKWSGNTIRNIIINPLYKGKRKFSDAEYQVPGIVEISYFDKVNANLTKNRNNSGKKVVHQYLLKGLIRCGKCGRNMYGRSRVSKHDHYYMCSSKRIRNGSCDNRSINIDKLDNFIWNQLFNKNGFKEKLKAEFDGGNTNMKNIQKDIDIQNKTIAALDQERSKAIGLALKNIISDVDLSGIVKRVDGQIKDAKNKLVEYESTFNNIQEGARLVTKYQNSFVDFTNISSFSQKQKVINDFIRDIVIECVDERHYTVEIDFKIDLVKEKWQTLNLTEHSFFKVVKDKSGEMSVAYTIPKAIKNPTGDANERKFEKRMDDELSKQQKRKSPKSKV